MLSEGYSVSIVFFLAFCMIFVGPQEYPFSELFKNATLVMCLPCLKRSIYFRVKTRFPSRARGCEVMSLHAIASAGTTLPPSSLLPAAYGFQPTLLSTLLPQGFPFLSCSPEDCALFPHLDQVSGHVYSHDLCLLCRHWVPGGSIPCSGIDVSRPGRACPSP